jgi:hypothetical protein
MPGSREQLIAIQKRLVEEIKESVYDTRGRNDSTLDAYYRDYRREFRNSYERIASRDEIVQRMLRSHITYIGDYHPLRSAQSATLGLLNAAHERGRKLIVACEMVHTADQQHVADFLSGAIDDEAFRWRVKWEQSWGFPWSSWGRFFDFARRTGTPLFGLNVRQEDDDALHVRDNFGGGLIAALTQLYPERLIVVVYGDLHLAANHMPAVVDAELAEWGVKRKSVRIYQNSETLYWKLVAQRLEHVVDYLKLQRDVYVVMNATPLVKFQSYANFQYHRQASLVGDEAELDMLGDAGMAEQVAGYVHTICGFLDIELEEPENFEVYSAADLDLLANLVKRGVYTADEMEALKDYMEMAETAFFERARVLYIGNVTVANAAEAAGRYILAALRPASTEPVEARDEFYARCMVEALAFFCSKIINPRRAARDEGEWQQVMQHYGRRRKLGRIQKLDADTARNFQRHAAYERKVLETGAFTGAPSALYTLPTDTHVALTRALGRALGEKLFAALGADLVTREQIADAMQDPIREPDRSRNRYFELLRATAAQSGTSRGRYGARRRDFDE